MNGTLLTSFGDNQLHDPLRDLNKVDFFTYIFSSCMKIDFAQSYVDKSEKRNFIQTLLYFTFPSQALRSHTRQEIENIA